MEDHKILKVTEDVRWIGVLDRDIVTFDIVMETKYGTTYNAYFIDADRKTLVETVKEKFWETYLTKLKQVVDPSEIEYIVISHTEPDHSGCLAQLLNIAPRAQVIGTGNAIRYLTDLLGFNFPNRVVKDGDIIDLGNKKLRVIAAPNLHWPDTMMTYLQEDKLLFTCDIFGEHFCHEDIFDDLLPDFEDAFRYYFDVIMRPFSKFMLQAMERIRDLEIAAICPGHGAILRSHWKRYMDLTKQYALEAVNNPKPDRVLIAYVSAYHNTASIAVKIAEGIRQAGDIEVDLCDIEKMELPLLEQKIMQSTAIIIGCPTFNQNILLPVYQLFALINPIRDRNKLAASFGSYGWSGEGVKIMDSVMQNLKLKVAEEGLMLKFTPHEEGLQKSFNYGLNFGKKMLGSKTLVNPDIK